jgi:hypothetical protein
MLHARRIDYDSVRRADDIGLSSQLAMQCRAFLCRHELLACGTDDITGVLPVLSIEKEEA